MKAQAALAADTAEGRKEASVTASSDASKKMEEASKEAEDIVPFAACRARVVMQVGMGMNNTLTSQASFS